MNARPVHRSNTHPIPDAAFDDRLAFVGTSGSGKTYNAGTTVERLLDTGARVGIVDPLGGWWGLRLMADGKAPSPYNIVIFGGEHADLPLTENAGALIGETAATMAESFILDLTELGTKAAERRFMLAFLTALYRKTTGDPLHVVLDEADMWAPQLLSDKEGDAAKLLGMMETIVRRGRIKGFIPWLITQRPAVLSKNVLSQADGLIAMKLTSSQDRAALGDWIEGQADRAEGKRILGEMPTLQRGQGVVWIPGRGILETETFPRKVTFDSSRTPTRGETKRTLTLKPLDLDKLKVRLEKVDAEIKANDPRALKARIAELERKMRAKPEPAAPTIAADAIRREAFDEGFAAATDASYHEGFEACLEQIKSALGAVTLPKQIAAPKREAATVAPLKRLPPPPRPAARASADGLTGPQVRILEALAFWRGLGFERPTRAQVGAAASYSPTSGNFGNLLGQLNAAGLVTYPSTGLVSIADEGLAHVTVTDSRGVRDRLGGILTAPQAKLLDALPRDGSPISREELGGLAGYSHTSGNFGNLLGQLRTLSVVTYPSTGYVAVEPWVWS